MNYPAWQNNASKIIRNLKSLFQEKPSHGLGKKLNALGVGINYTSGGPDDISSPEEFTELVAGELEPMSDEELASYL